MGEPNPSMQGSELPTGGDGNIEQQQENHKEVIARDESNGIVVFGNFVAGSLVSIIISAPAFVVLFIGSSASLVTKADSKVGKFSRKLEKWASDLLLDVLKDAREFNHKHRLTDKAKMKMQKAAAKVNFEVHKRGILKKVKAKASDIWTTIDKRTAPGRASLEA